MGRKSKYYHSEVKVEDISFQPLFGHDLKLYEQIQHRGKFLSPIQVWNKDEIRKKNICKQLDNPTYIVVWESDYRKDKKSTIEKLLKYFN